jgi:ATP synthase F1 complex assembly factor 2
MGIPMSKSALAAAIALEWDQLVSAQQALKHHYIPLTSLTARALDIQSGDVQHTPALNPIRESTIKLVMKYLGTDTLLCWAPEKNIHEPYNNGAGKSLRQRQREVAEPIIAYLTTHIWPGVEIVPILGEDSIVPISQPEMTREVIKGWVSGLPPFELAALERGVLATKSLLVATRLMVEWSSEFAHLQKDSASQEHADLDIEGGRFGIDMAAQAASLEVLHQTEQWGEVEDTHDVEKEDLRRQLGSVILLVS